MFQRPGRHVTSANPELAPFRLPWSAADPDRNPFAWDEAEEARLTELITSMVPTPPSEGHSSEGWAFYHAVTELLAARYGRWTCGWHWGVGEGGGGGVVASWCCVPHSVGEPGPTAARVVDSLLEWRDWLEELADRFEWLAPPPDASAEDRSWHLERAATRLMTLVVDRTGAEDGWYGLCTLVLVWFLSSAGVEPQEARRMVDEAIGGRFASWTTPKQTLVDAVGEDLAVRATGTRPSLDV
ncbi:hypothetical protein [Streptomyces olivochromogenes]|uniref:hypothetical protein n=1 Tax=Streptomyces olivochromogenes TaxID=1963 RepID=UPI001F39AA7E|nr:hypothetical protein [Streptomyces olivochromogenes]MCF3136368.1 hypothetical protein [Streptomyces olivochromogenes]